jgi:riboflavin synthase
MFTGLITSMGTVVASSAHAGGRRLELAAPWGDLVPGESIAVNGACLTVESRDGARFVVQAVATTLARTTLGTLHVGARVNLERALAIGDRVGGHWVQGHVDGVGTVERVEDRDGTRLIDVAAPAEVAEVSIPLGSVTVDGVSLTVNAVPRAGVIQLAIVPFTLQHTTLGDLVPGDRVQLEGDLVGKHVRAQVAARQDRGRP